jgi:hypothetical protein
MTTEPIAMQNETNTRQQMSRNGRGRTVLVAGLAALLCTGITSCSRGESTSALDPQPTTSAAAAVSSEPDDALSEQESTLADDLPDLTQPTPKPLDAILFGPDPSGPSQNIALRFVRALQRHDDLAADRELTRRGREVISYRGMGYLRRLMNDVRRNARIEHTGPCTRAAVLDDDSVAVQCGPQVVIVHVQNDRLFTGVQVSGWFTHDDVYPGPHSHAATELVG